MESITPTHWEEKSVALDGVKIRYHRTGGNRPPLVLIHGFTDNGLCWTRVAKALEAEYDIIMPDMRGHGHSVSNKVIFSTDTLADDVAELIHSLNLSKPIVMGHSMGGQTATILAAKYPELASKIVLEDPAYRLKTKRRKILNYIIGFALVLMIQSRINKTEEKIRNGCKRRNPRWHEDEIFPWAKAQKEFGRKESINLVKNMKERVRVNWCEIFPKISTPTLLVIPAHGMLKLKDAQEILPKFPNNNARIAFVEKAGHSVRRYNFPAYMKAIRSFFNE